VADNHSPPARPQLPVADVGARVNPAAEFLGVVAAYLWPRRGEGEGSRGIVEAGPVGEFTPASVTAFPQGRFYLVRLTDGGFLALSSKCSHLGCTVPWNEKDGTFPCPCHASVFDMRGNVLSPPAPRALDLFHSPSRGSCVDTTAASAQTVRGQPGGIPQRRHLRDSEASVGARPRGPLRARGVPEPRRYAPRDQRRGHVLRSGAAPRVPGRRERRPHIRLFETRALWWAERMSEPEVPIPTMDSHERDPLRRWRLVGVAATAAIVLSVPLYLAARSLRGPRVTGPPEALYVGSERCAPCHKAAYDSGRDPTRAAMQAVGDGAGRPTTRRSAPPRPGGSSGAARSSWSSPKDPTTRCTSTRSPTPSASTPCSST
jgi:cytochrome b6-f complex iron-sulfur subunit